MERESVPQDNSHTYGGHRKLLYAVDEQGEYIGVQSTGWDVECSATDSALDWLAQQRDMAWQQASAGEVSPLVYYMYHRRMDVALLAQTTGLFQWRVKRHFKPKVYAALPDRVLQRYSDALGMSVVNLRQLVKCHG